MAIGPISVGDSREARKIAVGPSAPPMMPLGRRAEEHRARAREQRREIGERPDAQEDERREEAGSDPEVDHAHDAVGGGVERVLMRHRVDHVHRHRVEDLRRQRDVPDEDAEADGDQEQRLVLLGDAEVEEEGAHREHHDVEGRQVDEAGRRHHLLEVAPRLAAHQVVVGEAAEVLGDEAEALVLVDRDDGEERADPTGLVAQRPLRALAERVAALRPPAVDAEEAAPLEDAEAQVPDLRLVHRRVIRLGRREPGGELVDARGALRLTDGHHREAPEHGAARVAQAPGGGGERRAAALEAVGTEAVAGAQRQRDVVGLVEADGEVRARGGRRRREAGGDERGGDEPDDGHEPPVPQCEGRSKAHHTPTTWSSRAAASPTTGRLRRHCRHPPRRACGPCRCAAPARRFPSSSPRGRRGGRPP